jgi:sugar lactone lactonase YvrE
MKQVFGALAAGLALGATLMAHSGSVLADGDNAIFAQLPDAPEGIAIDSKGTMYATTINGQQIFQINDDGSSKLIATVPSAEEVGHGLLIGLEADGDDNLIVAYTQHSAINGGDDLFDPHHPACRDVRVTRTGVYKVEPASGAVTAIATRADGHPFCFPDDVDVDRAGNIYLTDLTYAGIWKISADGSSVVMWSDHALLNWTEDALPLGVNVLVLDKAEENIFAATTTLEGLIVRIPINADGTAGEAVVHSRGHTFFDGIEIDDDGYLYVAEPGLNTILAVSPEAGWLGMTARKTLSTGGALQGPTSIVLRDGVLYTTNLAFGVPPENQNKAIVAIRDFERE